MQAYELAYIISSDLSSESAEAKAKEIESAIQSKNGVILQSAKPAAKPLAYPIKHQASGFWGTVEFQMEQADMQEVVGMIRQDGQVIRTMVLVKKPTKVKKAKRVKPGTVPATDEPQEPSLIKKVMNAITPKAEPAPEPTAQAEANAKGKVDIKDIDQELDKILGQ